MNLSPEAGTKVSNFGTPEARNLNGNALIQEFSPEGIEVEGGEEHVPEDAKLGSNHMNGGLPEDIPEFTGSREDEEDN